MKMFTSTNSPLKNVKDINKLKFIEKNMYNFNFLSLFIISTCALQLIQITVDQQTKHLITDRISVQLHTFLFRHFSLFIFIQVFHIFTFFFFYTKTKKIWSCVYLEDDGMISTPDFIF